MAQEVAQEVTLNLRIRAYRDPEDSNRYKVDITINGYTQTFEGYLDRKHIIGYVDIALQQAWAYLGFLERSKTEESRKTNLDLLLAHLEFALADALAYQLAQVDSFEEDPCKLWESFGEKWCATTDCADFVKEDFDACMEACKKDWCGSEPIHDKYVVRSSVSREG